MSASHVCVCGDLVLDIDRGHPERCRGPEPVLGALPLPRYVVATLDGYSDAPVRKDAKATTDAYVYDRWNLHLPVFHCGGINRCSSSPKSITRDGRIARARMEADRLNEEVTASAIRRRSQPS